MVNNRSRYNSISIQSCGFIDIKPEAVQVARKKIIQKESSDSESADFDLIEQNDASNRMRNYSAYVPSYSQSKFYLPRIPVVDSQAELVSSLSADFAKTQERTVVFIEDDQTCKIFIERLKIKEFNFVFSTDWESLGVDENQLKEGKVRAVFVNINSPGFKDANFIENIRRIEFLNSISIFIVGMSTSPKDKTRCLSFGMNEFCKIYLVLKPVTSEQLIKILSKVG